MSALDSLFSLPSLGTGSVADSLVSYATADASQLVSEASSYVQGTFGGFGNFGGLASSLPSLKAMGALPTVTAFTATASQVKAAGGDSGTSANDDHKIKLTQIDDDSIEVVFEVMPEVQEARNADYEPLAAPQMPGEFQKYKGTKSVSWNISATFACSTTAEATANYKFVNTLRAWVMPYFGSKVAEEKRGAPPPILYFSGWRGLVGQVPVVVQSVDWTWPRDVDWIPTSEPDSEGQMIPFPTVMNVTVRIVESYSAREFNNFDLEAFRNGDMVAAYSTDSINTETSGNATYVSGSSPVTPALGVSAVAGNGPSGSGTGARTQYDENGNVIGFTSSTGSSDTSSVSEAKSTTTITDQTTQTKQAYTDAMSKVRVDSKNMEDATQLVKALEDQISSDINGTDQSYALTQLDNARAALAQAKAQFNADFALAQQLRGAL